MPENTHPLVWARCRGRNGWDAPQDVSDDMATEALNWSFYEGGLGSKRNGSTSSGHTISGLSEINALYGGFIPGQDETARQMFIVDNSATNTIRRFAGSSTVSAALTLPDNINANDMDVVFCAHNGKVFIAYNGTVNRLKVFDPGLSTTALRYTGLGAPAAPTTATNGGAGLTFTRWYRVAYTEQRDTVTVRRGELSTPDDITITDDSGVTVTKPAALNEGETHWEIYAADEEAGPYYLLTAAIAVGTGTYSDSASSIPTDTAAPVDGENYTWRSVKYLYSNGSTLFGFGTWESQPTDPLTRNGTVYYSPAPDSSEIHDDERVRNSVQSVGKIVLGRNAGGIDRGIGGLGNTTYAFQSQGIYGLIPTENPDVRFRRVQVSTDLGAVSHKSIVAAEDERGRPALYFLDPQKGPYRLGASGFQWCGKDVKDIWDTFNPAASNVAAHGVYHKAKHQLMFWIATGSSNDPDTLLVCDVTELRPDEHGDLRGGWSKWTGNFAGARCSTMMSNTMGATMSRDLKPYVGRSSGTVLLKGDTSDTTDDPSDTAYQAYVQSKAWVIDPLYTNKALTRSYLLAKASSGTAVRQTLIRNFGDDTDRTSDVTLTAAGSETRVLKKFEDAALQDAALFQVRLGDASATASAFTLDRWYGAIELKGER